MPRKEEKQRKKKHDQDTGRKTKGERAAKKDEREDAKKSKKLKTLSSSQMWLPVRDIKDGIIITKDGRYVCLLEFAPINFSLRTAEEQDAVADTFGSILRVMPNNVQIKILSRQANVEDHVRHVQKHLRKETNTNCAELQREMIQLIRKSSAQGITRRFFLSFEYVRPAGLRTPEWDQIYSDMYSTASRIISMLEAPPCENECLSPIPFDTDYVVDMLYDCTCRYQAESIPVDIKCENVKNKFIAEGRAKNGQYIPLAEFISPQCIDPSHYRYLKVDEKYYAFGYIEGKSLQESYCSGWINQLISMGSGIDVDLWFSKASSEQIQQGLVYAQRMNNASLETSDRTNADYMDRMKRSNDGVYIQEKLSAGQELMYITIMLTVSADSKEALDHKMRWIKNNITFTGSTFRILNFNQLQAFEASLPLNKPLKTVVKNGRRNVMSGDLGSAYPFTSYEINDAGGIMLGVNTENDSPVFINAFNKQIYENANMAILGRTGSGKTYLSQCITLRLRLMQVKTVIIAPIKGHEYKRSCDQLGGQFIDLSAGSPHTINILEIRKKNTTVNDVINGTDSSARSILQTKIGSLKPFFTLILPDITVTESRVLDSALIETYRLKGITTRNKSLEDPMNPGKYKEMPTLKDLYDELKKNRLATRIVDALYTFVEGSAKSFSRQTNVSLDNPYTVLNLSNLSDDLMPVGLFIATEFVYDAIQADITQRKAILFDEIWKLIGSGATSASAQFVLEIAKAVRAYNAMAIFTTQDLGDFFSLDDGKWGTQILNCTKIQFVLGLTLEKEIQRVVDELNLSNEERLQLRRFKRGDALLIANNNHIKIRANASPKEHALINTDPEQLAENYQSMTAKREEDS